jgi:hypothetical protein
MRHRIVSFAVALLFSCTLFAQEEGAPVKLKLSGKYLAPKTNYVISGSTEIGKKPLELKVEIFQGKAAFDKSTVTTDAKGNFSLKKIAPEKNGPYLVKVTGADGKKFDTASFTVYNPSDIGNVLNKKLYKHIVLAMKGLDAADALVKKLPPSPTRDEFKQHYTDTRKGIDEGASKFLEARKDFVSFVNLAAKYPPVLEETQKYLNQLDASLNDLDAAEKNFEQQIRISEQNAAICDQLNFLAEAAGFISLVLDFQGKLNNIFINLASDKVMPGAVDRMKITGMDGQELENAKFSINTAQKALTASAFGFNDFKNFAKQGFSLDFIQFCAKGFYGKFCQELKGPFTGTFRGEFDEGLEMYQSYDMFMKGQLILRYEKGANSASGFAVTGEFEGVYTKYEFWEDFEKIEQLPKGLTLLMRKRETAKPIDLSAIPVPTVSKDNNTGKAKAGFTNFDINNDVGMIARQLLPGSFRIKVKGIVKNDKLTLSIDESALTNATNQGQKNKLTIIAASPIVPIPLVKTFDFPMAPAKSVFIVSMGKEQTFDLQTTNGQVISQKKIANSRNLENNQIRLKGSLDITIGSNAN